MPDASDPREHGFLRWGDAFAALPQEAPPADAWSRLDARLDAHGVAVATATPAIAAAPEIAAPMAVTARHHGRRRLLRSAGWLGAATAAALALVVAWQRHDAAPALPKPGDTAAPVVARAMPATKQIATAKATPATNAIDPPADTSLAAGSRRPKADAPAIALPKVVEADRKPRFANHGAPARAVAPRLTNPAAAPASTAAKQFDTLYAESARLETLLALARDDRVASAGAALLAAELDAQVAGIDASLAQPGLDDLQRMTLWRARVDALRQVAGFESTQRVLASQGDAGALLVSVD
jgi:hypothetical protein